MEMESVNNMETEPPRDGSTETEGSGSEGKRSQKTIPPPTETSYMVEARNSLGRDLRRLTPMEVLRLRTGFSRIVSPAEFRQAYGVFQNKLQLAQDPAGLNYESDLKCDDIMAETPAVIIENAIEREVKRHSKIFEVAQLMKKQGHPIDFRNIPGFGASVPNIQELEAPLAPLKCVSQQTYHLL